MDNHGVHFFAKSIVCVSIFFPLFPRFELNSQFLNGRFSTLTTFYYRHFFEFLLQIRNILSLTFNPVSSQIINRYNWRIDIGIENCRMPTRSISRLNQYYSQFRKLLMGLKYHLLKCILSNIYGCKLKNH